MVESNPSPADMGRPTWPLRETGYLVAGRTSFNHYTGHDIVSDITGGTKGPELKEVTGDTLHQRKDIHTEPTFKLETTDLDMVHCPDWDNPGQQMRDNLTMRISRQGTPRLKSWPGAGPNRHKNKFFAGPRSWKILRMFLGDWPGDEAGTPPTKTNNNETESRD